MSPSGTKKRPTASDRGSNIGDTKIVDLNSKNKGSDQERIVKIKSEPDQPA